MTDLKKRGLWDETLLVWGGEFDRTPASVDHLRPTYFYNGLDQQLTGVLDRFLIRKALR